MFHHIYEIIPSKFKFSKFGTLLLVIIFTFSLCQLHVIQPNPVENLKKEENFEMFSFNINGSQINNKNQSLVLKSIEKIQLSSSCQDNPYLLFLDSAFRKQVSSSLYGIAKLEEKPFCQYNKNQTNCCSDKTFILLKNEFDTWIKKKNEIFSSNIGIYYKIVEEHKRNLVSGLNFSNDKFDSIFKEILSSIDDYVKAAENVVKSSSQHKWNSYCNFICNKRNDICDVYNLTFTYNSTVVFSDFKFVCANYNNVINSEVKYYFKLMKDINSKISSAYSKINQQLLGEGQILNLSKGTKEMMMKSINDGLNSGLSNLGGLLCDEISQDYRYILTLNRTIGLQDLDCNNILSTNKFCLPFNCLDDLIFQFNPFAKKDVLDAKNQIKNYFKIEINSSIIDTAKNSDSINIKWVMSAHTVKAYHLINLIFLFILI